MESKNFQVRGGDRGSGEEEGGMSTWMNNAGTAGGHVCKHSDKPSFITAVTLLQQRLPPRQLKVESPERHPGGKLRVRRRQERRRTCPKVVAELRAPERGHCWCREDGGAGRDTHDFPHGLGRHAGVTVNQGLCGLREGVGDAVAETLSQAGPAETTGGWGLRGGGCSSQQPQKIRP